MLYSLNWIRSFVEVTEDPHALAHRLTMAGLPVERIEGPPEIPTGVVVGHVLATRQHPNADRLTLCTVDIGGDEPLGIVCGAPNVRPGIHSPIATVGTKLPNGLTIRKSKIRGEVSMGMICSAVEIGVGTESDGIMEIEAAAPGTPYAELVGGGDTTLDIDVPSNRGDVLSHLGLAREIAALTGRPLTVPEILPVRSQPDIDAVFTVEVAAPEDCPRFTAHLIRGITVGPSPTWLVDRLAAVGQRSINNVVDVTNFIMLELGQPTHAFDLDKLGTSRILVRRARANETITTLDDIQRTLTDNVLLITDGERPIAVGGVMGGAETEVSEQTVNILLEAAWFKPSRVLRGSRDLRLDTDAAIRFRRGVDPGGTARAAERAAALIAELGGGTVAEGRIDITQPGYVDARFVALNPQRVTELLGDPIPDGEIRDRLQSLGFAVDATASPWSVQVPTWRLDILEDCDLVEEVARHRGYDAITVRDYNASAVSAPIQPEEERRRAVSQVLRGFGFHEALTRTLCDATLATRVGLSEPKAGVFRVLDPPSREEEGLRVSLIPSLLAAVAHNVRHGQSDVRLFELGKTFAGEASRGLPQETTWIGLAATGGTFPPTAERRDTGLNLREFKGFVEGFLDAFRIDRPKWRPYNGLEPVPAGALEAHGQERSLGFLWEVGARVLREWDVNRPVFLAQIALDALPLSAGEPIRYQEASRFPATRRDLALVLPTNVSHDAVRGWITEHAGEYLEGVELFDIYSGKHIAEGQVGLGFRLTFRSSERTLEDKEIEIAVDRVVAALHKHTVDRREG